MSIAPRAAAAAIVLALMPFAAAAQAPPGKTLEKMTDIGPAISQCWAAPAGTGGFEVTVAMTFNRKGEVSGKPKITYSKLPGAEPAQKNFVAAALKAVASCTPLKFSRGLGGAVAGRPFMMRFINGGPQQRV